MLPLSTRLVPLGVLLALAIPAIVRADGLPAATSDSSLSAPELFDTDRPDVTNGSSRLDPGVVQVETGWSHTSQEDLSVDSFGDALVRVGISRAFELRVFTPGLEREFISFSKESESEWGEAGLGFKLGHTSANGTGIAFIGSIATPVESHGSRATDTEAVLALDLASGNGGASFNVGVHTLAASGFSSSALLVSMSVAQEVTRRLGVFLEAAGQRTLEDSFGDEWTLFADTGGSWAIAHHLQLDASVGRDTESGGPWTLGAGISKRW